GGVALDSGDLNANLNSSYPLDDTTWAAYVNNGSQQDSFLSVYAICAKQTDSWSIYSAVYNETQTGSSNGHGVVPGGTRGLGAGVFSSSMSLGEDLAESWPGVHGRGLGKRWSWHIRMTSGNLGGATFRVYAVCGSPRGYRIVKGASADVPTMRETSGD